MSKRSAIRLRGVLAAAALLGAGGAAPLLPPSATSVIGADVTLAPTRVVFGSTHGMARIALSTAGAPTDFTVALVDRTMTPEGLIVEAPASEPPRPDSARPFITVSPQTLRLAPGAAQSLTVRFDGASGHQPGEYRTHLTLSPEASGTPLAPGAARMLLSYSIPIIVRLGRVDVRAGIGRVRAVRIDQQGRITSAGRPALAFDLQRLGANSVYGDLEVRVVGAGPEPMIAALRGVAVYPEVASRPIVLPLSAPLADGATVRLEYIDRDLHPGSILASTDFRAPAAADYAELSASARARAATCARRRTRCVSTIATS